MAKYAIAIRFPHENHLEDDEVILTHVLSHAYSLEEAYEKMGEIKVRFEKEVTQTNRSKTYIIGIIGLPEEDSDIESAIRYSIDKASYSY